MVLAALARGVVAGVLAGALGGLVASFVGEPSVDAAIALEEAAASARPDAGQPGEPRRGASGYEVSRRGQKAGLLVGTALAGVAVGGLFATASAWAVGRVAGSAWTRSLKLGASAIGAVVVLPALKYPPNPPTVGDPATIAARTTAYLGLVLLGLLLAAGAWAVAQRLARSGLAPPTRQALLGLGVVVAASAVLAVLPAPGQRADVPADLLWSFRVSSIAVQTILWGGTALIFGLLAARRERSGAAG